MDISVLNRNIVVNTLIYNVLLCNEEPGIYFYFASVFYGVI